eukprot:2649106-Rhodomonas_salina.1
MLASICVREATAGAFAGIPSGSWLSCSSTSAEWYGTRMRHVTSSRCQRYMPTVRKNSSVLPNELNSTITRFCSITFARTGRS